MFGTDYAPDVLNDPKAEYLIKNLKYIAENGVEFKDNHSAYPTFTMNNAQAFATRITLEKWILW